MQSTERTCDVDGCERGIRAGGKCSGHWVSPRRCSLSDCDLPYYGSGYCRRHRDLWKRNGNPRRRTREEIFWGSIPRDDADACWLWDRVALPCGYAQTKWGGRAEYVHRVAVALDGRHLPVGMHVDHLCSTRLCVNPRHLEVVTPRENWRRRDARRGREWPTHCEQGHEFSPENTYRTARTSFGCVTCRERTR